jgi:DNA-binding CsgD family transcriptional regulator
VVVDPAARDAFAARALAGAAVRSEPLTERERDVLRLFARGLSNKRIAARLAISEHTVKFHVGSILAKLGAATRAEAVARGARLGELLL